MWSAIIVEEWCVAKIRKELYGGRPDTRYQFNWSAGRLMNSPQSRRPAKTPKIQNPKNS